MTNSSVTQNDDLGTLVSMADGKPTTTSLIVAKKFGKEHKHVLEAVKSLECSEKFGQSNFRPSSYLNSQNKEQPMITMTRDGFMILAMGFTGSAAMVWKEQFIRAFNHMERQFRCFPRRRGRP